MNKKKKITIFLQARIASTRLKEKIFINIAGKSMLKHIVERVLKLKRVYTNFVVITAKKDADRVRDHLADYPEVGVFGGCISPLRRFKEAYRKYGGDVIVRLTADNPLVSILHLKAALKCHIKFPCIDYSHEQGLPLGTGFEIMNQHALCACIMHAETKAHYEHVTPYLREKGRLFLTIEHDAHGIYKQPDLRLTVDEQDDLKLMRFIYCALYTGKPLSLRKVLIFLREHKGLASINSKVKQKSGW